MKLGKGAPLLLQFVVVVLMSTAASYAFQHTETTYQINGLCFYRYLAYGLAIFFGYVSLSQYKKYVGLTLSVVLSAIALSPIGQEAIALFPSLVVFFAVLMGVTTVLIVPNARGKGFSEFLVALILPALLVESRIGGSTGLVATTNSVGYYELSAITIALVGGYFYLRYATLSSLARQEFLSSGGNEHDVAEANKRSNLTAFLIIIGGSAIAASSMVTAPLVADALRATVASLPLYVLILALGAGIAIPTIFYIFQLSHQKPRWSRTR